MIGELIGTIDELAGTFDDLRRSADMLQKLSEQARSGANLRDKGALIDALWARAAVFVTSDRHLVDEAPAQRISAAFDIQIMTPSTAIRYFGLERQ
jgi:hypothetical protein